ncbi:MAG: conjugal transfer protein TraR [bacterium]
MAKIKTMKLPKKQTSIKSNSVKSDSVKQVKSQKQKLKIQKIDVDNGKKLNNKKESQNNLSQEKSSNVKTPKKVNTTGKTLKSILANKPMPEAALKTIERKTKKYKPNKKVRYSKSELKHFRDIILLERKAIFESAKANMDSLVDKDSGEYKGDNLTYSSHMAEQGTDEMEREKNYLFVQRDEKYLGYLQEALMRIDQGTYGICIDCKDEPKNLCRSCPLIVKERLELVPITQHCIECKNLRG